MEEEFQFLLCEKCHREAKNPKLLACLHTFCSECLEESKPIGHCPVCEVSLQHVGREAFQDNLLFANLQNQLNTYQKIKSNSDLVCDRCKEEADFWCSECKEFLCRKCYDAHQWYLKQQSHEAQRLADLKNDSALKFLEGARKSSNLFCSNPTHNNQTPAIISIYCRGCRKPLCCSCALLDNEHSKLYCNIRMEIEHRKDELGKMSLDLMEKKRCYEKTHSAIQERMQEMEKVQKETREEIQRRVEEMIQLIRQKGEELMGEVEKELHKKRQDVQEKLQCMERIVNRMTSSERLVEKMNLFASDQEVMDMHPFIRESLEELKKEKPTVISVQVQAGNFEGIKDKLQALYERVTGQKDTANHVAPVALPAAPVVNSGSCRGRVEHDVCHDEINQLRAQEMPRAAPTYTVSLGKTPHGFVPSITSSVKRQLAQSVKSVQASPKMMKLEDHDCDSGEAYGGRIQDAATSTQHPGPCESTPKREWKGAARSFEILENSPSEICESEVPSIVISSSEDTDEDTA